jgi:hypothetical protein
MLDLIPGGGEARPDDAGAPPSLPADLPEVLVRNAAVTVIAPDASTTLLSLSGRLAPRDGEMRGTLRGRARTPHTTADISLDARDLSGAPRVHLDLTGESALAELPLPADLKQRPTAGTARFALKGEIALPAPGEPLTPRRLLAQTPRLGLDLTVEDADVPGLASGLDATASLHAAASGGALVLRLTRPLTVEAAGIERTPLAGLGLPPEAVDILAAARRVTAAPWTGGDELAEIRPAEAGGKAADETDAAWRWNGRTSLQVDLETGGRLHLQVDGDGALGPGFQPRLARSDYLSLEARDIAYGPHRIAQGRWIGTGSYKPSGLVLDGTLTAAGLSIDAGARRLSDLSVEAPLALRHTPAGTRLTLAEDKQARVEIPDLPDTRPVVVETPVTLTLTALEATAADGAVQARATVDPGTLKGKLLRQGRPDADLSFAPGEITFELIETAPLKARVGFDGGRLRSSTLGLSADAVALEAREGYGNPRAELTLGDLRQTGKPAALSASEVSMTLHGTQAQGLRVIGRLVNLGTGFSIGFAARTEPGSQYGEAWVGPVHATFAPDGLQPGQLSPRLGAQLSEVRGIVSAEGRLAWTPEGVTSRARIELANLSFTTPRVVVAGLSGDVTFDSLLPPSTPPEQRLRAAAVTSTVPLTNVEAVFDLDQADGTPVVRIARAGGELAEGDIFVQNTSIRPLVERNALTLRVREVSLPGLIGLLQVEGLSATGRISGDIPVALGPEGLVIDDGRLNSIESGRIQVRMGQTSEALESQGQSVSMMVRALEDFRYNELALTLTRPSDGSLALGITMEGKNPDVLYGSPFRFNINLTGDVAQVLAALQQGRGLAGDLIKGALEGRSIGEVEFQ